jgi:hypothetical protein
VIIIGIGPQYMIAKPDTKIGSVWGATEIINCPAAAQQKGTTTNDTSKVVNSARLGQWGTAMV